MFEGTWSENGEIKTALLHTIDEMAEMIKKANSGDVTDVSLVNQTDDEKLMYKWILDYAYEKHKEDWVPQRQHEVGSFDEEAGINGERYACKEEFEYAEFEDEEYMKSLLSEEVYGLYEYMWLNSDFDDED